MTNLTTSDSLQQLRAGYRLEVGLRINAALGGVSCLLRMREDGACPIDQPRRWSDISRAYLKNYWLA
jgi:hypothetical protein